MSPLFPRPLLFRKRSRPGRAALTGADAEPFGDSPGGPHREISDAPITDKRAGRWHHGGAMGLFYHILQPPVKRPAWLRFAVTVAALTVAFASRIYLDPWLQWHSPFALLLPAVLVSAWYGGARAGFLATAAAGAGAAYIFMTPSGLTIGDVNDAVAFLLFLAEGILMSGICEVLHHAVNRAQQAATDAARTFEVMANNAPVLIWSTNAEGRCIFVNRNWLTFTGRTPDQELGDAWPAALHPDDAVAFRRNYAAATADRRPYQLEYRLRRADGAYRWLLEKAEPRYDHDGNFEGFIGSCTDISASRREREELDFLARLQRNLGASLDLERLAGVLAEAAVPHLADWFALELVHDSGHLEILRIHHADSPRASSLLEKEPPFSILASSAAVVETGAVQLTPPLDLAVPTATPTTEEPQRQRWQALGIHSHLAVPLVARGRIIGVLTFATADSDRTLGAEEVAFVQKIASIAGFALDNARLYQRTLRALSGAERARHQMAESERALDRHRALLKTIIDAVPALVAYIGPDGRILLHNERYREWLGEGGDFTGRNLAEIGTNGTGDKAAARLRAALGGETVSYEEIIHSTGPDRLVAATLLPDRDAKGRVCGVVFHAYDITERNKAYAELATARELLRCHADELEVRVRERTATLRETNAELEAFTYSVSHDLRTPLQFVRSFADAIEHDRKNALTPESSEYLARIVRAAGRMESIIHDLLGYSRLARADMVLLPTPLDEAVAEAINHHLTAIQRSGAQVEVDSPLPRVMADRVGLFQILSNLISNALKFTAPGVPPVIHVSAEVGPTFTRLWIADNGIGIPTRHQEKIFQLFERLHSASEYPGTGIGLALVRKAAIRMGGQCGVESSPGTGSRFWIDFANLDKGAVPTATRIGSVPTTETAV